MKREKQKQALVNLFLSGMMGIGQVIDEAYNIADSIPNWISVDDELPPKFEKVLVYIGIDRFFDIAYLENVINKQTWWMNSRREIFHVTHWMPLPIPPRKEE